MRSLRNKIHDFEAITDSDDFDLICFVDTILTSSDLNTMFLFDSIHIHILYLDSIE